MTGQIIDFLAEKKEYSVMVVRVGLAFVFLWFGLNQIFDAESFFGYVPNWAMHNAFFSVSTFVLFNGIFDSLLGFLLLTGFFTRVVASIATLHLLFIAFSLGYNDIAIRDVGLALMALSLVFSGAGKLSFDIRHNG